MHHAYYIEGPLSLFEVYKEKLKPLGHSPTGEAFWADSFDRFGVDDARALIEQAQLKTFGESTFLIAVGSITTEAQQALLKLFEEPQAGIMFVLIAPHGAIIPTLRSRMLAYPTEGVALELDVSRRRLATQFLKSSQKERSDYIAKLLKNEDDAREEVRALLNGLEAELHSGLTHAKQKALYIEGLQDIARVRSYINDRSPSLKMLFEHLAAALPQV